MTDVHTLDRLFAVIQSRKGADPETSYTAKLFSQGTLKIAKKLGEEGVETALAAVAQGPEALAAESADLLYHLLVLWAACGLEPAEIYRALDARTHRSGLAEKASR
ncbi:MAG: phosphoribosyl-ATP diphosphatase [Rhizomicrobium sp.]